MGCRYVITIFFSFALSTRFLFMSYPYGTSRSHLLDTPHSLGLPWTNDQSDAEIST